MTGVQTCALPILAGFSLTTVVLHVAGLGLGQALQGARQGLWRLAGSGLGLAGLVLLMRA